MPAETITYVLSTLAYTHSVGLNTSVSCGVTTCSGKGVGFNQCGLCPRLFPPFVSHDSCTSKESKPIRRVSMDGDRQQVSGRSACTLAPTFHQGAQYIQHTQRAQPSASMAETYPVGGERKASLAFRGRLGSCRNEGQRSWSPV